MKMGTPIHLLSLVCCLSNLSLSLQDVCPSDGGAGGGDRPFAHRHEGTQVSSRLLSPAEPSGHLGPRFGPLVVTSLGAEGGVCVRCCCHLFPAEHHVTSPTTGPGRSPSSFAGTCQMEAMRTGAWMSSSSATEQRHFCAHFIRVNNKLHSSHPSARYLRATTCPAAGVGIHQGGPVTVSSF